MKNQVYIHLQNNKVTNRQVLVKAFNELQDGRFLITIERAKKRSSLQNKYYWGCVLPLAKDGLKEIGYREVKTNEDAHEVLKYLFLKKRIPNEETGECIELLGSTANLTTIEFNEYINQVIQWAAEFLNIQIPLPNEPVPMFAK